LPLVVRLRPSVGLRQPRRQDPHELRLVERRTLPADRRVKELVLTAAGREVLGRLEELVTVAPGLSDLAADEKDALIGLLRRAHGSKVESAARTG
jgi:hypothetical protein